MSLAASLRRHTLWVLSGEIGARAMGFVFGVVLARLLLPETFGLVVTVQILTGVLGFIAAHGMNDALVRAREIRDGDVATIFTLQLMVCGGIVTGLNLIAPQFAAFFGDARLEPLMRFASLSFLLRPFQGVPLALLQREMRFRDFSLLVLLDVAISGLASIALVLHGFGALGLILGGLTGSILRTFVAIAITGWRPDIALRERAARELGSYGMKISINEIVQYARTQTANAVVSRSLGMTRVGLYNKADSLAEMPFEIIGGSAYQTLFRTLAAIQDEPEESRRLFVDVVVTVSFYAMPMYLGLVWVAEPLIVTIYGDQWAGAGLALQILALAGPARVLAALSRATAAAHNRLGREILIQLETWGLLLLGVLVGLEWGLAGVAVGVLPAFVHNAARMLALARRILGFGWSALFRALLPVLRLNALMLAALAATHWLLALSGLAAIAPLYLLVMVASGILAYGGVFLLRPPGGLAEESERWHGYIRSVTLSMRKLIKGSANGNR